MHYLKTLPICVAITLTAFLSSCDKDGWKTSKTGLKYKFLKDEKGDSVKTGDIIQMHIKYSTSKDSVLFNSFTQPQPIPWEVLESKYPGSLQEALGTMSEGDSAQFLISADSMFTKEFGVPRPSFVDSGSFLTFVVKILKKEKKEDFFKRMEGEKADRANKQKTADEALITNYIGEKGLTPTKTEMGVYVQVLKSGQGVKPSVGDSVSVHYTGRTLDGKIFDTSRKEDGGQGSPLGFVLGVSPLIQGWQDGIAQLKQGTRATLIIPSGLAYGEQASPSFGPNSVLTFDVELVKVIKPKK